MKILLKIFVLLMALSGVAAVQYKTAIKSVLLRTFMIGLTALSALAWAIVELSRITDHYTHWASLATINVLVPTGWLLAAIFALLYAIATYVDGKNSGNQ